jgi:hypothetical protein
VIDGAPEVVSLAVALHEDLVEVPTPMADAAHLRDTLSATVSRKERAKPIPTEPYRLVTGADCALEQQIFHVSQPQRETNVHWHNEPDHLRQPSKLDRWQLHCRYNTTT